MGYSERQVLEVLAVIRQKTRGSARMAEQGYRQVSVWLDKAEAAAVQKAADAAGQRLATWLRLTAAAAAGLRPNR